MRRRWQGRHDLAAGSLQRRCAATRPMAVQESGYEAMKRRPPWVGGLKEHGRDGLLQVPGCGPVSKPLSALLRPDKAACRVQGGCCMREN